LKNLSFKNKLFVSYTALILFFSVLSIVFVNLYITKILKEHFVQMGRSLSSTVASNITNDLLINDLLSIDAFFEDVKRNNHDVAYIFLEKDGKVVIHTFQEGFPKKLLNLGHTENKTDYVFINSDGKTYYDFSAPVLEGRAGTLRLGMSGSMISSMVNNTVKTLLTVAFVSMLASIIFAIFISRKLTKPLILLTESSMKISEGDYSKNVTISGKDEVAKLSHAFNKMAETVSIREKALKETNEELEEYGIKLHEYVEKLNKTRDELIKSKQDSAMVATSRALLHHLRQPLTYLLMAIELFADDIHKGTDKNEILMKAKVIEKAGENVSEILNKFEKLKEFKTVQYSDETRITDIEEQPESLTDKLL